jgi:hypothetical protein
MMSADERATYHSAAAVCCLLRGKQRICFQLAVVHHLRCLGKRGRNHGPGAKFPEKTIARSTHASQLCSLDERQPKVRKKKKKIAERGRGSLLAAADGGGGDDDALGSMCVFLKWKRGS